MHRANSACNWAGKTPLNRTLHIFIQDFDKTVCHLTCPEFLSADLLGPLGLLGLGTVLYPIMLSISSAAARLAFFLFEPLPVQVYGPATTYDEKWGNEKWNEWFA